MKRIVILLFEKLHLLWLIDPIYETFFVHKHGTAVYAAILDGENVLLGVLRNGKLVFPGGKMQRGEMPHETAERETEEEFALRISCVQNAILAEWWKGNMLCRLCRVDEWKGIPEPDGVEIVDFRWVPIRDLDIVELASTDMKIYLKAVLQTI